jgi:hypothetical protein
MPAQHTPSDSTVTHPGGTRNDSTRGAEAYPYDPTLRLETQRGLDRLRCVADRTLAADMFAIFKAAERNTERANLAEREQAARDQAELKKWSALAIRALAGELGADEKQLATHLLLDQRGLCATDLRSLRDFKRALFQLRRQR